MKNLHRAAFAAAMTSLVLAGCSGGSEDPQGGDDSVIKLDVSVLPIAHTTPVQIAIDEGIFKKHGLDVTVTKATTGAAAVPSVMNGSVDIAYGNLISTIQGRSQKLPIISIATSDGAADEKKSDTNWVMVRKDSEIKDVKDLAGKTVAVNALNGLVELITRGTIDELGGDSSKVKFTEIPFPEMLGALEAGRVDAISQTEPFRTIGTQTPDNVALIPVGSIGGTRPGLIVDTYFTSESFLGKNAEAVKRFRDSIYEAQKLATDKPEVARDAIAKNLEIPKPILDSMNLPQWASETISEEDYTYMTDLMEKYDLLKDGNVPSYDDVVRE